MREERRGRRTRAIRPDDRREVAERADDLPAAVRLPILDLEAVEAAALLRHCESRAVGGLWARKWVLRIRLSRHCPGSKGLVCSKDDSHDDHPRSTRRRRRRRSVAGGSAIPTTSRGAPEESYCQRYLAFDEVSGRRSNPRFQYRRNLGFIISFALPASPRL